MIFRGTRLSELQLEDIQRLVSDEVQERDTVEYKRDMYGNSDSDRKEMLRDITSMANHRGGYLTLGVEEDGEGIPTSVVGVEPGSHVERITSCCLNGVDKRILGLEARDIPIGDGRVVVVISIPESINAPHMVTHTGLNQFWRRHGRQKDKMTIDEIGESFDKRLSNLNRLDRFLFSRRAEILEDIGEQTFMVISASPAYLRNEAVLCVHDVDLHNLIRNPPRLLPTGAGLFCGSPYPTINGLRADNRTPYGRHIPPVERYVEVFASGYIEFGTLIVNDDSFGRMISSRVELPLIVDSVSFIRAIYEQYLPFLPLVLSFSILNARGVWLSTSEHAGRDRREQWQRQHLELGGFYVHNISAESQLLPRAICDRLWQCFHRETCHLFDDAGTCLLPSQ